MSEFLKRGEGKFKSDVKKYDFYSYYRKHAKNKKLERTQYSRFTAELLKEFSEAIVKESLELKLYKLGNLRIQAIHQNFFNKHGKLKKSLKVDWKTTWEKWEKLYKGLSRDEIVAIKNKKVHYFENDHSNGEYYQYYWDNHTTTTRYKSFYKFKPARQFSRLIAKEVKKENRKVFYYG